MMSNLRDFMIVLWVVMQGLSWGFPQAYGYYYAQSDAAYDETAEKLGMFEQ